MGFDERQITVDVRCRVSRHNSPQDRADDALFRDLSDRIHAAVAPVVRDPRYASLRLGVVLPGGDAIEGGKLPALDERESTDAQVTVSVSVGTILAGPLRLYALMARAGRGELLTFTYRDQVDDDDPEAERPLRRARLLVQDDGLADEQGLR